MNLPEPVWLTIGLLAQAAFSARFLVQWLLSERARRSMLPVHFSFFSVLGAGLLLAYAAHQRDAVIVLGQVVGLAIYLRNIELVQRAAGSFAWPFWAGWLLIGGLALGVGLPAGAGPVLPALAGRAEPAWFALGLLGQSLFTGRFIVQLVLSERAGASVNPLHFWTLSISGSLLLLAYALHTGDGVIILGQGFGLLVYLRNLALIRAERPSDHHGEDFETDVADLRAHQEDALPVGPAWGERNSDAKATLRTPRM